MITPWSVLIAWAPAFIFGMIGAVILLPIKGWSRRNDYTLASVAFLFVVLGAAFSMWWEPLPGRDGTWSNFTGELVLALMSAGLRILVGFALVLICTGLGPVTKPGYADDFGPH